MLCCPLLGLFLYVCKSQQKWSRPCYFSLFLPTPAISVSIPFYFVLGGGTVSSSSSSSSPDPLSTLPLANWLGHGAIWDVGTPLFFCGLSGDTRTWCHSRVFNCSWSHWKVILEVPVKSLKVWPRRIRAKRRWLLPRNHACTVFTFWMEIDSKDDCRSICSFTGEQDQCIKLHWAFSSA